MGFFENLARPLVGRKPNVPELTPININDIQQESLAGTSASLPQAENIAGNINQFNLAQASKMFEQASNFLSPGSFNKLQDIIAAELRGEVPEDVSNQVVRGGAARALAQGTAGSPFARNLTLRDLGLTSLGIQQQGKADLKGFAPQVQPYNFTSLFFTPQQRYQAAASERDTAFNRNWLQEQITAAPSPFGQFIQNVVYAIAGTAGRNVGLAGGGGTGGMGA